MVGSCALNAYLPDEELGVSVFLCHGQENSWFIKVNEHLCMASSSSQVVNDDDDDEGGNNDTSGSNNLNSTQGKHHQYVNKSKY